MKEEEVRLKLIELLRVPISRVVIKSDYIETWTNHIHLGNVPFAITPGTNIVTYDIEKNQVLEKLNWSAVVSNWINEISQCIVDNYDGEYDPMKTTSGLFGILYLRKNSEDVEPIAVHAYYDGVNWNITEK
ncbi:MAG: hypothetical protein HWE22_18710 [Flavobacteriales bacterium]|nr:hypothetical protein [Flavobacteriales bacterium]